METIYGPIQWLDVTAWQSVNAVCLGCLTHGACVGHWTPDYSVMEAIGSACKEDG